MTKRPHKGLATVKPECLSAGKEFGGDVKNGRHTQALQFGCHLGEVVSLPVIKRQKAKRPPARRCQAPRQLTQVNEVKPPPEDFDMPARLRRREGVLVDDHSRALRLSHQRQQKRCSCFKHLESRARTGPSRETLRFACFV